MIQYLPIFLTLLAGLLLTIGDLVIKKWTTANNWFMFALAMFIYLSGLILMGFSFKYKNIAIASLMTVIFNILSLFLVSWFLYGEKLNLLQIIAMSLGMVSVIILEISS